MPLQTEPPLPGRRICVVGTSGSGKTTIAMALADRLGLRYVCNDAIIWRPDWQATPKEEVYDAIDAATREDGWTFDGNLGAHSPEDVLILQRCDTIVWLDLPRRIVHWRVTKRALTRIVTREPLWHGNRESLRMLLSPRDSIVWWSLKTFAGRRRAYGRLFADPAYDERARIHLQRPAEVEAWLAGLPRGSMAT